MNGLIIFLIVMSVAYVICGFVYAGRNAMIDLNWAVKLYRSMKP